jgi:hypothetical protein
MLKSKRKVESTLDADPSNDAVETALTILHRATTPAGSHSRADPTRVPGLGPNETTQHLRPTTIIVLERLGTTLSVTRSLRILVITYW